MLQRPHSITPFDGTSQVRYSKHALQLYKNLSKDLKVPGTARRQSLAESLEADRREDLLVL